MKKIVFLLVCLFLTSCSFHKEIKKDNNLNIKTTSWVITWNNFSSLTWWFDRKKFVMMMNVKVIKWSEETLSGMKLLLSYIQDNIQTFNKDSLNEFKNMMALYEQNIKLTQQLIDVQKNFHNCMLDKFRSMNPINNSIIKSDNIQEKELQDVKAQNIKQENTDSVDIETTGQSSVESDDNLNVENKTIEQTQPNVESDEETESTENVEVNNSTKSKF